MKRTHDLYILINETFPTPDDLRYAWQKDVERGADGETPLGFLLDWCKQYGYCKMEAYEACWNIINVYNLWE